MEDAIFNIVGAVFFSVVTYLAFYRPKVLCRFFNAEPTDQILGRIRALGMIGVISLIGLGVTVILKFMGR